MIPLSYSARLLRQLTSPGVYMLSAFISILLTVILSISHTGKDKVSRGTYEEVGSFKLTGQADEYLRESTSRVRIANSTTAAGGFGGGSGSKSSVHCGSSGRSHGGGGRKF